MSAMWNLWRWVFAQFYRWNTRRWGGRRTRGFSTRNAPAIYAVGAVTVVMWTNLVLVVVAFAVLAEKRINFASHRTATVVLGLLLLVLNYVRFMRYRDADAMIARLSLHDARETRRDFAKLFSFLILSVVLVGAVASFLPRR